MSLEDVQKNERAKLWKLRDRLGSAETIHDLCTMLYGYASWHGNPAQDLKRALDCYLAQESNT